MAFKMDKPEGGAGGGNWLRVSELKNMEGGKVRVRLLDSPVSGFEGWSESVKVFRAPHLAEVLEKIKEAGETLRVEKDNKNPKQFWAFPVANVTAGKVQAMSITQKSIALAIIGLAEDAEWGDPTQYDIIIARSEKGGKVEYSVTPCKPTKLAKELADEWTQLAATWTGLTALYEGADPFAPFGEGF